MAFNGSGVFQRIYNWVNDRDGGIKIQATRMDTEMDGFATGLSNVICRDGQSTTTDVIPFAAGINVAAAAPAAPAHGDMWLDSDGLWIRLNSTSINIQPIGMEIPWGSNTPPAGWIMGYGQNVSRTTYAKLFGRYGTTYGAGDGSTTFGVPDYRGRAPFGRDDMGGAAAGRLTAGISGVAGTTLGAAGGSEYMHQHTHNISDPTHTHVINDPTHSHNVNDPTHAHSLNQGNIVSVGTGALDWDFGSNNFDADVQYGGVSTNAAGTGIWLSAAGTGVYNSASYSGISVIGNGGGASQNVPPALVRNWIIFAGV